MMDSGGGGFLHPTHMTGFNALRVKGVPYVRVAAYPTEAVSRRPVAVIPTPTTSHGNPTRTHPSK